MPTWNQMTPAERDAIRADEKAKRAAATQAAADMTAARAVARLEETLAERDWREAEAR